MDDLPLSLGGTAADIASGDGADPGRESAPASGPHAYIAADGTDLFVQPAGTVTPVLCNGGTLTTSQWLHDGDVLTCENLRLQVVIAADSVRFDVERRSRSAASPRLVPPPRPTAGDDRGGRVPIRPVDFTPKAFAEPSRRGRFGRPAILATWVALAALAGAAWFTFTARTVEIDVEPEPDRLEILGTVLQMEIGGRHLLHPGTYTVVAEKEGYRRLEAPLEVSREPTQSLRLALERLPGLLSLATRPPEGVAIVVDGEPVGVTPLAPIELAAGEHTVEASAERYRPAATAVTVAGAGSTVEAELVLEPLWAPISLESRPSGAVVRIDGETVGRTPLTTDVLEGERVVELRLDGYKPHRSELRVAASEAQELPPVELRPVEGWLSLTTRPSGATITIDGAYHGPSPLELELAPGVTYELAATLAGHDPAEAAVLIESGRTREVHLDLVPRLGEISITAVPADAELLIDGEPRGVADQTVELPAVPHRIEIRKPGYVTVRREVTPRPGFPAAVEVELETEEAAREAAEREARPPVAATSQGQELRLVGPGRFEMGASRREPGRRANETLREVEITRHFYIATEEVSNAEYGEFRSTHRSGSAGGITLDLPDQPVVGVAWEEAARYCNWLSDREGLEPFYVEQAGRLVAAEPLTAGYRLPTEAEWAWVARYEGGGTARKYAWGDALPVAPGSGNYADTAAQAILPATISGYSDTYPVTAPVDSFAPNGLGIHNLGGNVAEWVHDYYSIYSSASNTIDMDPIGPAEGEYHVIRGSSWMDSTITELRLSYRDYANEPRSDVGFRVARYADSGEDPQ